jgi:cell division protein FtsB
MIKYLSGFISKRVLAIVLFVVVAILLMDLNYRITEYFQVSAQRDKVETQVYDLWLTREALKTEVVYANSDAAVEKWAREEGKMVRPGEVRAVPLPQEGFTPTVPVEEQPTPEYHENWEYWWAIFFEK